MDLTLIALWVHVPFVTAWVGLAMFEVFVAATPGLTAEQRARMLAWFRPFIIVSIAVIMVTGIRQTMDNPFVPVDSYSTLKELRERTYGLSLFWKHVFVVISFVLTLAVHFVFAPRLAAVPATVGAVAPSDPTPAALRPVLWLSVLNLLACIAILLLATRMVWELH